MLAYSWHWTLLLAQHNCCLHSKRKSACDWHLIHAFSALRALKLIARTRHAVCLPIIRCLSAMKYIISLDPGLSFACSCVRCSVAAFGEVHRRADDRSKYTLTRNAKASTAALCAQCKQALGKKRRPHVTSGAAFRNLRRGFMHFRWDATERTVLYALCKRRGECDQHFRNVSALHYC